MSTKNISAVKWQLAQVNDLGVADPVDVIAAMNVPYLPDSDRLQTLSIYLPSTSETRALVGTAATALPDQRSQSVSPRYLVHVHGGAWRDPELTSASIEPTAAQAFSGVDVAFPIVAIASINYRVSQFPTAPTSPYDASTADPSDPAREAVHPQHLMDVLHGLALLQSFGLGDKSYILSGHSCGACLALQASLLPPLYFGLENMPVAPCPAAVLGLNGLYDLPGLVYALDPPHEHLRADYESMLSNAFGVDESTWAAASPARFDPSSIADRVRKGKAPRLVVLDQSTEDQLVPMSQRDALAANLANANGLRVAPGHRCTGRHATAWQKGSMIWESLGDVQRLLQQKQ